MGRLSSTECTYLPYLPTYLPTYLPSALEIWMKSCRLLMVKSQNQRSK